MKKLKFFFLFLLSTLFVFAIAACGEEAPAGPSDPTPSDKDITGITFTDETVTYDGQEHELLVTGTLPEGVSVAYTNNKGTDVGEYNATAVLSGTGYNTLTLHAKLTINGKTITGITFTDKTVEYTGAEQEITVTGTLPDGVSVAYTNNKGTDVGTYNATAVLSGTGYNTLTLHAKLTINGKTITGITFNGEEVTYDGNEHEITISGTKPQDVTVAYTNNSGTNAGTYNATATLTGRGYNTLTLTATLTINKATITGVTFAGETFSYDGQPHRVEIAGAVPDGSTVVYSREGVSTGGNVATATGNYEVTVTITNPNYETFTATATLRITASEKERHIAYFDGTLYFANARDNDALYSYADSALKKVGSDIPYYFTAAGNTLYFRSGSLLFSSIKKIDAGASKNVFSVNGEYLCTDGTYIYYAENGLTNGKSGIYKLDPAQATSDTYEPTLVSQGKAKYLTYADEKLWFADGNNGWKLSWVSTSGTGTTRTVVAVGDETEGEKINALTTAKKNGTDYLFFTVNNLLGDYIANYNTKTNESKKLTIDAGANLTVVGDELYYLNVDLLTSTLYGKGIYKVNAYPLTVLSNITTGEKVIGEDGENYSSLCAAGNGRIAYYQVSAQDLCLYTVAGGTTQKLLTNFVAPEVTPLSLGSKVLPYGTKVYWLDLYNDKALYCIDTAAATQTPVRVTSEKVSDFAIIGDTLYFNAVSWGVNNDLYKVDLRTGGEPELVSENDCVDIVTDGTNIFYGMNNEGGFATAVHKIDAAGTDTEIYSKGTSGLTYYDGYLYFVDGGDLMKTPVTATGDGDATVVYNDHDVGTFVISDGIVYFRELYFGNTLKRLACINVDGTGYAAIVTADTDPLSIQVVGDTIYYYSNITSTSKSGIFSISKTAREDVTPTLILTQGTQYYADSFTVLGNKLYFVNYHKDAGGALQYGDSHLYSVELSGSHAVEKLA